MSDVDCELLRKLLTAWRGGRLSTSRTSSAARTIAQGTFVRRVECALTFEHSVSNIQVLKGHDVLKESG